VSVLVTEGLTEPAGRARGDTFLLRGTAPGAGNNFSFPVPGDYIARPVACVFTLTTSNHAANRYVTVEYQDGGGVAYAVSAAATRIAASNTQRYCGSVTRGTSEVATGTDVLFPLSSAYCFPGSNIAILVASIDTADTLTGIMFVIDRFFTGPRGERVGVVPAPAG